MIDSGLLSILRELQIEAYRQITIEQRGGRAVEEEELKDFPTMLSFAVPEEKALPEPCKQDPPKNLDEMVQSVSYEQLNIYEAIKDVEQRQSAEEMNETEKVSIGSKISAYLQARKDWHMERMRKDYTYNRTKQQVKDRVYGFEYMAAYIDRYIRALNKDNE